MTIRDSIKNAYLAGNRSIPVPTNAREGSSPIATSFSVDAARMYQTIGPYAGNVFVGEIQGIGSGDFTDWTEVVLRAAPVVDATTGDNMSTDWQRILIIDRHVDYIPIGSYVHFNDNTWIVYNPENVTSDVGTAVVIRCNTMYNSLDWYGNVISTPMAVLKGKVLASSPFYMEYAAVMDGYGHAILQYNDDTKHVHDNVRFILGNSAYSFYGVVNYAREFTNDHTSVHIIKSDFRVNELLDNDDVERGVAGGRAFRFSAEIGGIEMMQLNDTQTMSVEFFRNGEQIANSTEHPLDVTWETSDKDVAIIDSYGVVTSVSAGDCTVIATLTQNPNVKAQFPLKVESPVTDGVQFTGNIPESVPVFTMFIVEAAYFHNGERTNDPITFEITGVPDNAVTLTVIDDNSALVEVWTASGTMHLSAVHGQDAALADVVIEGF